MSIFLRLCSFAPKTSINSSWPLVGNSFFFMVLLQKINGSEDTQAFDFAKKFNKRRLASNFFS
jgi:hypothetical protein